MQLGIGCGYLGTSALRGRRSVTRHHHHAGSCVPARRFGRSMVPLAGAARTLAPLLLLVGAVGAAVNGNTSRFDVVVYDASSGGVMAAVAAGRHGSKTALLCASWPACFHEGGHNIGGMSGGGLGQTDIGGHAEIIGGLAREFYERNRQHYAVRSRLSPTRT